MLHTNHNTRSGTIIYIYTFQFCVCSHKVALESGIVMMLLVWLVYGEGGRRSVVV